MAVEDKSHIPPIEGKSIHYGYYYDKLEPHRPINIAAFGEISLVIDEENLGLEKVSLESLKSAYEQVKPKWEALVEKHKLTVDPFTLFGLYHIQRKVITVLGPTTEEISKRKKLLIDLDSKVNLSQMKNLATCSELAALAAFIAQKIGWEARLVIGSAVVGEEQWREAHAFVWLDNIPGILDLTAVEDKRELLPLYIPEQQAGWHDFEAGRDIKATRIGTNRSEFYGVEAGGFGVINNDEKQ
jgi:hypothetical protein